MRLPSFLQAVAIKYTVFLLLLNYVGFLVRICQAALHRIGLSVGGGFGLYTGVFHLADWTFVDSWPRWLGQLDNKVLQLLCCFAAIGGCFSWIKAKIGGERSR